MPEVETPHISRHHNNISSLDISWVQAHNNIRVHKTRSKNLYIEHYITYKVDINIYIIKTFTLYLLHN
jgi:hypothetical protein